MQRYEFFVLYENFLITFFELLRNICPPNSLIFTLLSIG